MKIWLLDDFHQRCLYRLKLKFYDFLNKIVSDVYRWQTKELQSNSFYTQNVCVQVFGNKETKLKQWNKKTALYLKKKKRNNPTVNLKEWNHLKEWKRSIHVHRHALRLFAVYLAYTHVKWHQTSTCFFSSSSFLLFFNSKQLARLFFSQSFTLKYSQMESSTFARAAAVFTRACIYVCLYVYVCVYVCVVV